MRISVNRNDYSYNYAYDSNGDVVGLTQGNIPQYWTTGFAGEKTISFSKSQSLEIGDFAFYQSTLEGDVVIADNVVSVGREAFTNSSGIQDVYINIPESAMFDGQDEVNPFYNGPVGKLYVSSEYVADYGGVGEVYPQTNGMEVALWENK